jgi:zinc D-Ala-D-Ala dipeptidase
MDVMQLFRPPSVHAALLIYAMVTLNRFLIFRTAAPLLAFFLWGGAQPDEWHTGRPGDQDTTTQRFRSPDLVEITRLDPTIKLDIRYATSRNFLKRKMYSQPRAFLQRPAAEALVRVNAKLRKRGYGLVIFDAYRPWSVTKKFWELTPPEKRDYVANPREGSRHNRGGAVDVTMFRLTTGKEVAMPSDYDDFSERASPNYAGGTAAQRGLRNLLRSIVESEGFVVSANEWWHFNYKDWKAYELLDIPFEKLN